MKELIYRFFIGGAIVSVFAALADALKPKSFAGLLGAAPSVGLATLALTIMSDGSDYAAREARSMTAATAAFLVYACTCTRMMMRWDWHAGKAASMALSVWFAVSLLLWFVLLK